MPFLPPNQQRQSTEGESLNDEFMDLPISTGTCKSNMLSNYKLPVVFYDLALDRHLIN